MLDLLFNSSYFEVFDLKTFMLQTLPEYAHEQSIRSCHTC